MFAYRLEVLSKFLKPQKCGGGGVGRYYRSGFVHLDCGPIRTWRG